MHKIINIEIYDSDLMIIFGQKKELKKALKPYIGFEEINELIESLENNVTGRTWLLKGGQLLIYMPHVPHSKKDLSALSHEIFHAAHLLLQDRGIKLTLDSDEAYSYLIQFITRKVLDYIPVYF